MWFIGLLKGLVVQFAPDAVRAGVKFLKKKFKRKHK